MTAAVAPPADAEIGWTELDDISQVGLADAEEARENSFEEADAATLAELGLLPSDDGAAAAAAAQAPADEAPAGEAPKPSRGRRPAKASAPAAPPEAPKARRGRARSSAAAKAPSEDAIVNASPKPARRTAKAKADTPSEEGAPKPRSRSRAKPATEPAPAEGAEEGIWQRFRGARTKTP